MRKAPLRLLFCGTPSFAVPTLRHLLVQPDFEIVAVITQPDRPRGRGQEVSFSPVKDLAVSAKIPVFQPGKIRTPESEQFLREANADANVIIAYGQIIPARLLDIPRLGWINLHASLLPKYRGAAPIQWAIASGETVTGVTSMRIDAGMDTGDIILQHETPIAGDETTPQLAERLATLGAPLIADTLRGLRDNTLKPVPQDHPAANLAPLLKKEDGLIDWQQPAQVIYNRMRGFIPWPGAYSHFRGTRCHLLGQPSVLGADRRPARKTAGPHPSLSAPQPAEVFPGQILQDGKRFLVACGQQSFFRVSHVKQEGRKQVSALEFANGARLQTGEHFGDR
jgi:methionyl-tRNA formyltransferase